LIANTYVCRCGAFVNRELALQHQQFEAYYVILQLALKQLALLRIDSRHVGHGNPQRYT
jgi:hypothetical protein